MSRGTQRKRRRAVMEWLMQPLEGRVLLSQAGNPTPAQVASSAGQVQTTTYLQASTPTSQARPQVKLVATVQAPGLSRPVSNGEVRFSILSPNAQTLGTARPNSRGNATLKTSRLHRGETYVVQAQYLSPGGSFASSSTQLDVTVGQDTASGFIIRAPQFFGAPGTPITFSVIAVDQAGQPVTNYTGTIQFISPTDHSAKFTTRTYTFTAADQGQHQFFAGVTFHKGGAEVVKVLQQNNTSIVGSQPFGIE